MQLTDRECTPKSTCTSKNTKRSKHPCLFLFVFVWKEEKVLEEAEKVLEEAEKVLEEAEKVSETSQKTKVGRTILESCVALGVDTKEPETRQERTNDFF